MELHANTHAVTWCFASENPFIGIYSYKECGEDLNRNPVQVNKRIKNTGVVECGSVVVFGCSLCVCVCTRGEEKRVENGIVGCVCVCVCACVEGAGYMALVWKVGDEVKGMDRVLAGVRCWGDCC